MHSIRRLLTSALLPFAATSLICTPALASVVELTASLYFQTPSGINYFDPANGYAIVNKGASMSPTVYFREGDSTDVSFEFNDGANNDGAIINLTNHSLFIYDLGKQAAYDFYLMINADKDIFSQPASSGNFGADVSVLNDGHTLIFHAPAVDRAAQRSEAFYIDQGLQNTSRIRFASAVPEPAAWLLMVAGFGFIGGAMRYNRRLSKPPRLGSLA